MARQIGQLTADSFEEVLEGVVALLKAIPRP